MLDRYHFVDINKMIAPVQPYIHPKPVTDCHRFRVKDKAPKWVLYVSSCDDKWVCFSVL